MTNYDTIPQIHDDEEVEAATTPTTTTHQSEGGSNAGSSKLIIGGALSMLLVFIAVRLSTTAAGDVTTGSSTMLRFPNLKGFSSSSSTACSFKECWASNCNQKLAPYTCLFHNGGPHGGCSATPWVAGSCTTSCSLEHCAGMNIPKGTPSCDKPCTKEVCTGDRLCHSDAPYQCTNGAAAFGCALGSMEWTLKTSSQTCSSCCDATTCKKD